MENKLLEFIDNSLRMVSDKSEFIIGIKDMDELKRDGENIFTSNPIVMANKEVSDIPVIKKGGCTFFCKEMKQDSQYQLYPYEKEL